MNWPKAEGRKSLNTGSASAAGSWLGENSLIVRNMSDASSVVSAQRGEQANCDLNNVLQSRTFDLHASS